MRRDKNIKWDYEKEKSMQEKVVRQEKNCPTISEIRECKRWDNILWEMRRCKERSTAYERREHIMSKTKWDNWAEMKRVCERKWDEKRRVCDKWDETRRDKIICDPGPQTSHKGLFVSFFLLRSGSWTNKLSIVVWFVRTGKYLAEKTIWKSIAKKNLNIEKIAFKDVQMKFSEMHNINQNLSFDIFMVGHKKILMEHDLYLIPYWCLA